MLHACQPSVIRTETPPFWRLKSLSFEGNLEGENGSIFLVIKCKQRFFGCISTISFSAGAEAQRCRGNWSKTALQPNMGLYRYLLPLTTYVPTKLHSTGPYAIHEGGDSKWKGKWKNEFGRSLQSCTNHYCVGSGARPRGPEADRF